MYRLDHHLIEKKFTHKVEKVKRQIYPQESSLYANFHGF